MGFFLKIDYFRRCQGELFWIVNNDAKYIKACDTVGIKYSYQHGQGYWLSHEHQDPLEGVTTKTCPAKRFHGIDRGNSCNFEKWKILVAGKKCGEVLEHQDIVSLQVPGSRYSIGWTYNEFLGFTYNYRIVLERWENNIPSPPSLVIFKWGVGNLLDL